MLFTPRLLLALGTTLLLSLLSHASPTSTPNGSNNNVQIVLAAARAVSSSTSVAQLAQRRQELGHLVGDIYADIISDHPAEIPLDVVFSYAQGTPNAGLLLVPVFLGDEAGGARQLGRNTYLMPLRQPGTVIEALPSVENLGEYNLPGLKAEGAVVFHEFLWDVMENAACAWPLGQQWYAAEVLRLLRATEGWMRL